MKKLVGILFFLSLSKLILGQLHADRIKSIIQREVANKRSKSIIVGILDPSGIQTYSAGILNDSTQQVPDGNTLYDIGSITKLFTSLLLADLSLKKKVNLDDPISKYLPKSIKSLSRNGKEISLIHLSSHRAGFPRFPFNMDPKNLENPMADYSVNDLYYYLNSFELTRDIDSKWQYSNIGYGLLGHILSNVEGKDFENMVKDQICKPLGMSYTTVSLTPSLKLNKAIGHTEYGKAMIDWTNPNMAGAGSLYSNVYDLLSFASAYLSFNKTELSDAIQLTLIPRGKKDGNDGFVTMGWTLWNENGEDILWKDGGSGGCRSFIGIDRKNKFGVVILSNSDNPVQDIGMHILDSTNQMTPYQYQWELYDTILNTIQTEGLAKGIQIYDSLKSLSQSKFIFNPYQLNAVGIDLRNSKMIEEAIKIFELNKTEYPNLSLVYESLAETYKRNGNHKLAIANYSKLKTMEPQNPRWEWLLKKLSE